MAAAELERTDHAKSIPEENEVFRIKKLATSNDIQALQKELVNWSGPDIDNSFDNSGKNILHHAAWRGSIQNIAVLLDHGGDINSPSIGEFSYGKSAIFFAITRCRDDMTLYLLSRGASCRIVNNKGQSVLSLASTHLKQSTINIIKEHECAETCEWLNYRLTHSDGRIYGDLEPRFMERPIIESDIVTLYAVNPTTKLSRRGNFARNNPGQSSEEKRREDQEKNIEHSRIEKIQQRSIPPPSQYPSEIEVLKLLNELESHINNTASPGVVVKVLCCLFDLYKDCKTSWLPELVTRIKSLETKDKLMFDYESVDGCELTTRNEKLLRKCIHLLTGTDTGSIRKDHTGKKAKLGEGKSSTIIPPLPTEALPPLPPPQFTWVDNVTDLSQMRCDLKKYLSALSQQGVEPYLAIDTEWVTMDIQEAHGVEGGKKAKNTIVATIQIAVRGENDMILCWVVDALSSTTTQEDYLSSLNDMLVWMWYAAVPLGFALNNDVEKLQNMVPNIPLSSMHCVDIQKVASKVLHTELSSSQPAKKIKPGLKFCVGHFMSKHMCKKQQMSDWQLRPLTQPQLSYAALDAVVLLPLIDILKERERVIGGMK